MAAASVIKMPRGRIPWTHMIQSCLTELNDANGTAQKDIKQHIINRFSLTEEYVQLSLPVQLQRLADKGLVSQKAGLYKLVPQEPTEKRGRGRPKGPTTPLAPGTAAAAGGSPDPKRSRGRPPKPDGEKKTKLLVHDTARGRGRPPKDEGHPAAAAPAAAPISTAVAPS
eukprot:TRINITY_DN1156_c1_g1_i1.p1 TRINITY_DN1156_c1_g1~~TRINITY_DN1156_c1_g1_i1.p1  ORF type:complete len:169 (+),score=31.67 TRINITY_DN1156_c1_g1_i1:398-904(+)